MASFLWWWTSLAYFWLSFFQKKFKQLTSWNIVQGWKFWGPPFRTNRKILRKQYYNALKIITRFISTKEDRFLFKWKSIFAQGWRRAWGQIWPINPSHWRKSWQNFAKIPQFSSKGPIIMAKSREALFLYKELLFFSNSQEYMY